MKHLKTIACDLGLAAACVLLYSPGFLNLRPWDPSIIRATLSICLAILIAVLFYLVNSPLIKGDKDKTISQLNEALRLFRDNPRSSDARTAMKQYKRLLDISKDLEMLVGERFEKGSVTYEKYISASEAVRSMTEDNLIQVANRLHLFSSNERYDLEMKENNHNSIKKLFEDNDRLIGEANHLALELADKESNESDEILEEITKLTEQLKYYA
ncbi:MAG: hypothetical protein IJH71_04215 [Eubacterium sp.]|nr:hypothetical protein [Eubacterium sp.]